MASIAAAKSFGTCGGGIHRLVCVSILAFQGKNPLQRYPKDALTSRSMAWLGQESSEWCIDCCGPHSFPASLKEFGPPLPHMDTLKKAFHSISIHFPTPSPFLFLLLVRSYSYS